MKNALVSEWMSTKLLSINPNASLTEADVTMEARGFRRLLVVDEGKLVGVLSLGDLREAKSKLNLDDPTDEPRVRDLMTPDPITMPQHATIALAAQTMLQAKISGLPVVNDTGDLIGILSESDIFRYVVEMSRAPH